MQGRLEKSCDYLSWNYLAEAVLGVFLGNKQTETQRPEASADVWAINSRLRKEIYERSLQAWCHLTGLDETWFPYSEDGVARMYFRFRKRNEQEIKEFMDELKAPDLMR